MPENPPSPTTPWTRREFVGALAGATAAAGCASPDARYMGESVSWSARPKRVAIIATKVARYSHAQHFVDRFLEGYGWHGAHHRPPFELAGFYVDQFPEDDLARERAARHGQTIQPTIAAALTLGGAKLAVDGVLLIGEHGNYPVNDKGQTLYPRYKFFKEIVRVFEQSGRAVPVFNDKHLSTDWSEAVEMVEDSRRLKFALHAGSSLPVTWRIPEVEIPLGTPLAESVAVCYGGIDSYDFHGLETAQCMSERRAGGETGVRWVHAAKGEKVWALLEGRETTQRLLLAALNRSEAVLAPAGYTFAVPTLEWMRRGCQRITAYFLEHNDGFRTTMFLLNGSGAEFAGLDQRSREALWRSRFVRDFTYAGQARNGDLFSCKMHLPMPPYNTTLADFFNPLVNHFEQTILTGTTPYPVERTLLTTGMTAACVDSLARGQERVETPWLKVAYGEPRDSQFWRA